MINQEDKWMLMTTIGIPWTEFENISEEDQKFLLNKAKEMKKKMEEAARNQQNNPNVQLMPPNYS